MKEPDPSTDHRRHRAQTALSEGISPPFVLPAARNGGNRGQNLVLASGK